MRVFILEQLHLIQTLMRFLQEYIRRPGGRVQVNEEMKAVAVSTVGALFW